MASETGHEPRVLVDGEATGGRLALIELVEIRGGGPPRHLHHWEDEIVYVLSGEVTFQLGETGVRRSAGSTVVLPHGVDHTWRVESEEARLLIAYAPAGIEAAYREGLWSGGSLERMVALAARYGIEITGPPPAG